ncbi:hypothetical protein GlitD10_2884 [Gloeomargarita lithophora Alchichica-D10]|uniref:Uncharacterized protein n=2 Tax=Gloeomargarita TaxID=1188227 RepID=A0A1J0AH24_9CYAN|nr:hypothetical protein GlitD10_2884 [Gloeomargarita lithophora Alchichica-D10]
MPGSDTPTFDTYDSLDNNGIDEFLLQDLSEQEQTDNQSLRKILQLLSQPEQRMDVLVDDILDNEQRDEQLLQSLHQRLTSLDAIFLEELHTVFADNNLRIELEQISQSLPVQENEWDFEQNLEILARMIYNSLRYRLELDWERRGGSAYYY